MTADLAKYIVMNEDTLGYVFNIGRFPALGPLARIKSGHSPMNGTVMIGSLDKIRPATKADFKTFRVSLPPDHPEFDPVEHAERLARHRALWECDNCRQTH